MKKFKQNLNPCKLMLYSNRQGNQCESSLEIVML